MTMLEKIAKALAQADNRKGAAAFVYRDQAKAVLEVLRIPDDAMLKAGHDALIEGATSSLDLREVRASVWSAMVDEAAK